MESKASSALVGLAIDRQVIQKGPLVTRYSEEAARRSEKDPSGSPIFGIIGVILR